MALAAAAAELESLDEVVEQQELISTGELHAGKGSAVVVPLRKRTAHLLLGQLLPLLLGQLLSLLLCLSGIFSKILVEGFGISAPSCQNCANYVVLASVYTPFLLCSTAHVSGGGPKDKGCGRAAKRALPLPWWQYTLLALLDVEANYLVVKAYALTSFTSVRKTQNASFLSRTGSRKVPTQEQVLSCRAVP
eukprot:SAG11_NODE_2940_length_2822_cov_3.719060_1_plen_192_part_00